MLRATIREVFEGFCPPNPVPGALLEVSLCWQETEPVLQVTYRLEGEPIPYGAQFWVDAADEQLNLTLESMIWDEFFEPSDRSRGALVDGVWWWAPGTTETYRPLAGEVLFRDGAWV